MAKRRILIFGWSDSVHVQRWCEGLSCKNFEIKLVSVGGEPLSSVETVNLPRKGKLSYLSQLSRAAKEADSFKPDLVHAHYAAGNGLLGLSFRVRPFLVSVWGSDIDKKSNNLIARLITKRVLRKADHITATSRFLKEETEKLIGSADNKISVIPFGVTIPESISESSESAAMKICFIKNHRPVYGADILIKAMAEVKKLIPDIGLSLTGAENSQTPRLKILTDELGLSDNIQFVGHINHSEIYSLIKKHDFMVMPSRAESFGVAALESSACGRAVVAANVGGVPEVVIDRKTGILVEPDNPGALAKAIIELAKHSDRCREMGRAGYEFVKENFDWEKSLETMSEIY
ncbi:MAG: glycosyltransferase family 4 protein, partial [candidate division Zixibacteria bacterium]|nr:glycosyltransferase family 4 protein [candidate division Zixibacteria bacterium]